MDDVRQTARRVRTRLPRHVFPAFALVIVGVTIALAVFGAVVAASGSPVEQLIAARPPEPDEMALEVTVTSADAQAGELLVRIAPSPGEAIAAAGFVTQPFSIRANDARGQGTRQYEVGDAVTALEVAVPMVNGAVTQYPFDDYRAPLAASVLLGDSASEETPIPVAVGVGARDSNFRLSATVDEGFAAGGVALIEFGVTRSPPTVVYVWWTMILMWGLALASVFLVIAIYRWGVDFPFWIIGFFVGVLFALPPLRNSLPGAPPSGAIVDYLAFYWALAIVGLALLAVIAYWLWNAVGEARRALAEQAE